MKIIIVNKDYPWLKFPELGSCPSATYKMYSNRTPA